MKSLYPISLLLAACSLAPAQRLTTAHDRGLQRPLATGVTPTETYVSFTVAGAPGTPGYSGDGGAANAALLANPLAVAVDSKGNYYISDYTNHVIREVMASTGAIVTIAGNGTPGFSGDGGLATSAQFSIAHSLAVDAAGNLYIADGPNGRVRVVSPAGMISTFAGNGTYGYAGDGGLAVNASLYFPVGVAVDPAGNVFIADDGNATVRMVSAATGIITTVAGNGAIGFQDFPGEGGPANQALLGLPYSVAVSEAGNVFIDDVGSGSIREVGRDGIIHTIVPNVSSAGIAADPAGNLYYADYVNAVINKVLPDGTVITIAGTQGIPGFSGDGGPGIFAQYSVPYGIALDPSGNIYVADYQNDVIRLLSAVPAPNAVVANGASELAYSAPGVPLSIAPGEVVSLFGNNIGFPVVAPASPDANGIFETQYGLTTVTVNGIPAPILVTGPTYVSVVVPYELNGSGATTAKFVVTFQGNTTATATVPYADSPSPGIFTILSSGATPPGALYIANSDGSGNAPGYGAAEGSTITFFVTGEGQTSPPGIDGLVTGAANQPVALQPVTVTINGVSAMVVSATEATGQTAGILQVNATIPSGVTTSNSVPLQVQVGTVASQTVTVAVQ